MFILSRNIFMMLGVVVVYVLLIAAQLSYANEQALPFAKIYEYDISSKSASDLHSDLINVYNQTKFDVRTAEDDTLVSLTSDELGVQVGIDNVIAEVTDYPLWQRLIPLSLVFPHNYEIGPNVTKVSGAPTGDETPTMAPASSDIPPSVDVINAVPIDASIVKDLDNNLLTVIPARNAVQSFPDDYAEQLSRITIIPGEDAETNLKLPIKFASIQTETANDVAQNVNENIADGWVMQFNVPDTAKQKIGTDQILKMMNIVPNPEQKTINISINESRMTDFLLGLIPTTKIVLVKDTVVHLLDGDEKSRETGNDGKSIDYQQALSDFNDALEDYNYQYLLKGEPIKINLSDAQSKTIYESDYTNDIRGLQKLLEDRYGRQHIGIAVLDLKDRSRKISVNGDSIFETASTYKMFVAYSMYKSGHVFDCLSNMIVISQNECAWDFLSGTNFSGSNGDNYNYGWPNMINDMHSLGLNSVSTDAQGKYSSVNDEALFLTKLYDGLLSPPLDKDRLIDLMKNQVFRKGIPTGVNEQSASGVMVADKVGFLDTFIHDAGIVYTPRGDYVEVVLTDISQPQAQSWSLIAEIAHTIEHYLHP